MYIIYAIILFAVLFFATPFLGVLGVFLVLGYTFLGFSLGFQSFALALAALLAGLLSIRNANKYLEEHGALSHVPRSMKKASIGLSIGAAASIVVPIVFDFSSDETIWTFILTATPITTYAISIFSTGNKGDLDVFKNSVESFEVIEKYDDDPKWATYIHFKGGGGQWNKTIPGSAFAKDPKNDLTFVHFSKEKALEYSKEMFPDAMFKE